MSSPKPLRRTLRRQGSVLNVDKSAKGTAELESSGEDGVGVRQAITAGSTLYLTSSVLISQEGDISIQGALSAPPDDKSCCLRVENERFSPECLFKIVYRKDGQGRASLQDEISKSQRAMSNKSMTRSDTSRTMTLESSDDVLDSLLNWDPNSSSEVDKENASFKEAFEDFGQRLRFGDYVNLLHVVSNKVVSRTDLTAGAEMQCLEVALNKDVSIDSYFQIMPQYKSRSIGEIVYSGDPIYLKCCGGTGDFFLRASNKFKIHEDPDYGFIDFSAHSPSYERRLKDNRRMSNAQIALHRPHKWSDAREVNASSKPSPWMLNLYSPYEVKSAQYLSAISPFRLRHPETDCYLSHTIVTKKTNASLRLKGDPDNVKTVWMFERFNENICWRGGVLHWGEKLRLLHVPTNLYLDIDEDLEDNSSRYLSGSKSHKMYKSTLSTTGCPIELEASRSERGPMHQDDCNFYIKTYIEDEDKHFYLFNTLRSDPTKFEDDDSTPADISPSFYQTIKTKNNKYDGNIITFCSSREPQDTFTVEHVDASSLSSSLSVFSNVKSVFRLFQRTAVFVRDMKKAKKDSTLTEVIEFPPKCLQKVKDLLIESTLATHHFGSGKNLKDARKVLTNEPVGYLIDGNPAHDVQDDMQTSHLIDIAMNIVCLPQLLGITLDEINTPPYSQVKHLIHLTYTFILNCLDNAKIKDYICSGYVCTYEDLGEGKQKISQDEWLNSLCFWDADAWIADLKDVSEKKVCTSWIDMMISHLGYELGVGEVLSQLFLDNNNLLRNGVTSKSVETFVRLIKIKGPQSRFLNFLKVLARCKQVDGSKIGITQNQELLMNIVFKQENHADVVIETALNLDVDDKNSERPNRSYLKISEMLNPSKVWDTVNVGKEVMGAQLTEKGAAFKDIVVSWSTSEFWFPGMGSEFSLFHSPEFLGINSYSRLNTSVLSHPIHSARNNQIKGSTTYDVSKPYGFEGKDISRRSMGVIEILHELIKSSAKQNLGVYPNFEPKFLEVMKVAERHQLARKTMSFHDFMKIMGSFKINDHLLNNNSEIFFRECCLKQTKPFPEGVPEGNALDVCLNFMRTISRPTNDLAWVRLEELVWVLDMNFKSPMSAWRSKFYKLINEDPRPKNFDDQVYDFLGKDSRNNFDTIYHKVHCQDINCNGYCKFSKHKEFAPWASTEIGGKKSKEQFKQMKRLANFYNENLQLVAESCGDRSNNCIRHFQVQYTFEMVFTGITNEALPPEIRSSFTKLMISLYVDRYPHERVLSNFNNMYVEDDILSIVNNKSKKIPLRAFVSTRTEADIERINDHIQSIHPPEEKNKVRDFFNKKSADKFLLLRDYIANFMILNRYVSLGSKNKAFLNLQSSILDMVYELLDYGFYGSMASLRKILNPLLEILDTNNIPDDDEEDDSNDEFEDEDEEEDEGPSVGRGRNQRNTRSTKSGRRRASSVSKFWLDDIDDDDNHNESSTWGGGRRRGSTLSARKNSSRSLSFGDVAKAANAAVMETAASKDSSVITLDLQPSATILPKYKLSNSNARVHIMREKICKIVYLMCSRNTEIMMKRLMARLHEEKDRIDSISKMVNHRRRMSADKTSFLDSANLEKFNAKYKKIYQETDTESTTINNLKIRYYKSGRLKRTGTIAKLGGAVTDHLHFPKLAESNSEDTFSSLANEVREDLRPDLKMENEEEYMLSLFFGETLMKEANAEESEYLDLEEIRTNERTTNSIDTMLIDLMMHEMPDLFESAIRLLTQRYFMKRTLYQDLRSAVVVGKEEAPANNFLRRHLRQLRNDATSFELWKGNTDIEHSRAYIRSIKTLGTLSRLTGIFDVNFCKRISGQEGGGPANTDKLLEVETLEKVRKDVEVMDIEAREDSSPMMNKVLFGMDSSIRNVSIYWHTVLSSCKDFLSSKDTPTKKLCLPVLLGVYESGYNTLDSANSRKTITAIHNNLMTINQAVRICLRILGIPFDELEVENNVCPDCGEPIPRTHIALGMEYSDLESFTFNCFCPNKLSCKGDKKIIMKKKQRELFALKRKCMTTLQHMALTNLEARNELVEKLPEIQKYIMGGLGAEKCFLAITSCSEYYKKELSPSHVDDMISVLVRCYSNKKGASVITSLETVDTEPITVALRYLRLVAMNSPSMRVGILRKLCDKTSIVSSEFLTSPRSIYKEIRDKISKLESSDSLSPQETFEFAERLQIYTLVLNLLGELAANKDTEVEGILQNTLSLNNIVDVLCNTETLVAKLPMTYGVKIGMAKCLVCCWLNTSIGVPNLIKEPQLQWLIRTLKSELDKFMYPGQSEHAGALENESSIDAEDFVLQHNRDTKRLAQRNWIYSGVLPILCAFFDDSGPWDASEAPEALAIAEQELSASVENFIITEKNNHDHTSELVQLGKVFNSQTEVSDGSMQLGRLKKQATFFMRAKTPITHLTTGGLFKKSTTLQRSLQQYVEYLEGKGTLLHELFRYDELLLASKLIGGYFIKSNKYVSGSSGEGGDNGEEEDEEDLARSDEEDEEEGGEEGEEEDFDNGSFSFDQIAGRMIRFTEEKLSSLVQGENLSDRTMEVCRTNIIILQRCCELAASRHTNAEVRAMSRTTWKGEQNDTFNSSSEDNTDKKEEEIETEDEASSDDNMARLQLIQETLGSLRAMPLCATIIGLVEDEELVKESMKLGHWLVKHGNYENQSRFLEHIMHSDASFKFFRKIDSIFAFATETIAPGQPLQDNIAYNQLLVVVPFLKELMENHRSDLQITMGDQSRCYPANSKAPSYNILQRACSFILTVTNDQRAYTKRTKPELVILLTEILVFLIESTQGPCETNQDILVSCGIITAVKRILHFRLNVETSTWDFMISSGKKKGSSFTGFISGTNNAKDSSISEDVRDEGLSMLITTFKRLKEHAVKVCLSLLEGRNEDVYVHDKIMQEMPSGILEHRLSQLYTRWNILSDSNFSEDDDQSSMKVPETFRQYIREEKWLDEGFDILALFMFLEKVSPGISRGKFAKAMERNIIPKVNNNIFRHLARAKTHQSKEMELLTEYVNELALFIKSTEKSSQLRASGLVDQQNLQLPPQWESEKKKWDKGRFEKMIQKIVTMMGKPDVGMMLEQSFLSSHPGSEENKTEKNQRKTKMSHRSDFDRMKEFHFGDKIREIWSKERETLAMKDFAGGYFGSHQVHLKSSQGRRKSRLKSIHNRVIAGAVVGISREDTGESFRQANEGLTKSQLDAHRKRTKLHIVCSILKHCLHLVRISREYLEKISGSNRRVIMDVNSVLDKIRKLENIVEKQNPTDKKLSEVFNLLKEIIPVSRSIIKFMHPMIEHSRSFTFFSDKLKSIEVQNENQQVEKLYFKEPLVCEFFTPAERNRFKYNLKLERETADMKSFVSESRDLYHMLLHKQELSGKKFLGFFDLGSLTTQQEYIRKFQVNLVYLCSFILLLSMESKGEWDCCQPYSATSKYYGWPVYGEDFPTEPEMDYNTDYYNDNLYAKTVFKEKFPECFPAHSGEHSYNFSTCTNPESSLLTEQGYRSPYIMVVMRFTLVLIGFLNGINAFIHFTQKHKVNLEKIEREDKLKRRNQNVGMGLNFSQFSTDREVIISLRSKSFEGFLKIATYFLQIVAVFTLLTVLDDRKGFSQTDTIFNLDRNGKQLSISQYSVIVLSVLFFTMKMFLAWRKRRGRREAHIRNKALRRTFLSMQFIIPTFTAVCAFLSIKFPVLIPFLCISVIENDDSLRIVFAAIYEPIQQLAMVSLLILMVVFLFSSLAFFHNRKHYVMSGFGNDRDYFVGNFLWESKSCDSMINCFFTMATFGLIGWSDDFYGSSFMGDWSWVVGFNLLLFILVSVIVLNVITAILLDNFTKLRQEREQHSKTIANNCVICGMSSTNCDLFAARMKNGKSFHHHIFLDHNVENYVLFIFHLMSKNEDEYTGVESYVDRCLKAENYNVWVPRMTSYDRQQARLKGIDDDADEEDEKRTAAKGRRKGENVHGSWGSDKVKGEGSQGSKGSQEDTSGGEKLNGKNTAFWSPDSQVFSKSIFKSTRVLQDLAERAPTVKETPSNVFAKQSATKKAMKMFKIHQGAGSKITEED